VATDSQDAEKHVEQGGINLVIADRQIPEMNTLPLLSANSAGPGQVLSLQTDHLTLATLADALANDKLPKILGGEEQVTVLCRVFLILTSNGLKREGTAKKQLLEQLTHDEKMVTLGRLVAGVAHELNNPLAFITSNLNNLLKFTGRLTGLVEFVVQQDLPDSVRSNLTEKMEQVRYDYIIKRIGEMIERSGQGAARMRTMVQDLKLFARKGDDKPAEADINAMLDSALNIMYNNYKGRIEISKEYDDLPKITCRIDKLEQVIINLINNACQAIEDTGDIRVTTHALGDKIEITVADSGCGMTDDVRKHVFDEFFTTKPGKSGTGLGLAISMDIVKKHDGEFLVESEVGKGSKFIMRLPVGMGDKEL
jgi:two-component system NtrC family sensor kinase